MPRPRKWRNVCRMPGCSRFGPLDPTKETDRIFMSVEAYETIRLIDLEGLTQEECTGQMNVARTTVQGIYNEARKKLADSLVNGKILIIEGGDYLLCGGNVPDRKNTCRCRRCWIYPENDEESESGGSNKEGKA